MDKPTLKNTLKFFECLGKMKSRSMFGGFGIFCDETMFALVVNDKLHLRAGAANEEEFKTLKMQPYVYKKRGFPVVTKYYAMPYTWWEQSEQLMKHAVKALSIAQEDQQEKKTAAPSRIKDLPNLRLATERMLKKAGIESVEALQRAGAVRAYQALQESHNDTLSLELLWALEGAIEGKHWSVITPQRRNELLQTLHQ
ncbi:TfoX/Sxy family DNA transformation protein [Grimontia hollisae]|uniref:Regulator of competence-specific genes n=1 Tax=Grimontia hollisae TaxID=673 RepID=A0A377HMM2_GRIHO|nr:TfoX/Sxy family DNA transformation protein [Grimontia hollisae]MDF2184355.1 TfoX/Sxy family DNA transformation protein [Grimontia hollisae]STO57263.1 Regulator of competence-specific genes [Grimontia hollisae]STQ75130.1 Regulator of competence-specific genes [Grimontia hollisae]